MPSNLLLPILNYDALNLSWYHTKKADPVKVLNIRLIVTLVHAWAIKDAPIQTHSFTHWKGKDAYNRK